LAGADAAWVARTVDEHRVARLVFRHVDGAAVLETARRIPVAAATLVAAGISERSSPDEVVDLTLRRLLAASRRLCERGADVDSGLVRTGGRAELDLASAPALLPGVALEEALE
jgi:hypothetical protein